MSNVLLLNSKELNADRLVTLIRLPRHITARARFRWEAVGWVVERQYYLSDPSHLLVTNVTVYDCPAPPAVGEKGVDGAWSEWCLCPRASDNPIAVEDLDALLTYYKCWKQ
jgi:hypothetical protein